MGCTVLVDKVSADCRVAVIESPNEKRKGLETYVQVYIINEEVDKNERSKLLRQIVRQESADALRSNIVQVVFLSNVELADEARREVEESLLPKLILKKGQSRSDLGSVANIFDNVVFEKALSEISLNDEDACPPLEI